MTTQTNPALRRGDAARCTRRFGYEPRVLGVPALPPDADETAWLAARRPLVTASDVAAVLGVSLTNSAFSLWWRKQPDWPHPEQNLSMHIGRKLEAVIGELWAEAHPEAALYRPGASLWVHPVETWLGATPDYLSVWADDDPPGPVPPRVHVEPVECKSDEGGPGWGKQGTDEVPEHHLVQVLVQCLVLGVPRGRLFRLYGKRTAEYSIVVDNHPDLVARIVREGKAFHASLTTGVAPDIDGHAETAHMLADIYTDVEDGAVATIPETLAKEFREAKQAVADAKALEAFATNRIRDLMGRAKAQYAVTPDGTRVAKRIIYKRQGYTVGPCTVDQIRGSK
jgi:predicted phage-related endonuclease